MNNWPVEYYNYDCRLGWAYIPPEEYAGKLDFEGGYNDGANGGYLSGDTTKIYAPGTPTIIMGYAKMCRSHKCLVRGNNMTKSNDNGHGNRGGRCNSCLCS